MNSFVNCQVMHLQCPWVNQRACQAIYATFLPDSNKLAGYKSHFLYIWLEQIYQMWVDFHVIFVTSAWSNTFLVSWDAYVTWLFPTPESLVALEW